MGLNYLLTSENDPAGRLVAINLDYQALYCAPEIISDNITALAECRKRRVDDSERIKAACFAELVDSYVCLEHSHQRLHFCKMELSSLRVCIDEAISPGIVFGVTQEGIKEAGSVLIPIIFNAIEELIIEEVNFEGGDLRNIVVHISEPAIENTAVRFVESAPDTIEFRASGITVLTTMDFDYTKFVSFHGSGDVEVTDASIVLEAILSANGTVPAVDVTKLHIDAKGANTNITINGNLATKVARIAQPILKGVFE